MAKRISDGWWIVEGPNGKRTVMYLTRHRRNWDVYDTNETRWERLCKHGYRLIRKINLWEDDA